MTDQNNEGIFIVPVFKWLINTRKLGSLRQAIVVIIIIINSKGVGPPRHIPLAHFENHVVVMPQMLNQAVRKGNKLQTSVPLPEAHGLHRRGPEVLG